MKEIKLKADSPLYNYVDIRVIDFMDDGLERERCKVTCDFGKYDVEQLIKRGLTLDGAMEYYKDWLRSVIKVHLASDWEIKPGCEPDYEEVLEIIHDNVKRFY